MHLTRYHGVFAPHSKLRAAVTPAHRGIGAPQGLPAVDPAQPPTPRHVAMNWARRLKRVFGIQIEACAACGGKLAMTGTPTGSIWRRIRVEFSFIEAMLRLTALDE